MDGSGAHRPYATPPRGMSLAPTVRPPPAGPTATPSGLTRARPASANTRLRQKPGDAGQQDFFASLGVDAAPAVPARRNASFTAGGSNRSFSNITMRTSAGAATTTTTSSASSGTPSGIPGGFPSGLNLPSGIGGATSAYRSGPGFFNSGTSSTSATPTGASTALGGTNNWRSPAAGAGGAMFGAASASSTSLRSPAFGSRSTAFNSGMPSPAASALKSPAAAALQGPSPFGMKSPAARHTWSAPPVRTTTPSGASMFATSTSATPAGRSFATSTSATPTAGSLSSSAGATPTGGSFTGSASTTPTARPYSAGASATPTGRSFAATASTMSTTTTISATGVDLGRTVTTRLATHTAATSTTSWQTGLSSAGITNASEAITTNASTSATPSSVTSAAPSSQKPAQLFSMDDADDMFEDDGWGCDSPSTVLSNPMEETESAEVQSAVKEESDEFGWAEDDFAMVDASLTGQPTQSSSVKSANVPAAGSEAISSSITFSTASDVSFASATASTFGAKSMEEQSWSTSRPSLPNAMDSKLIDASFTSQQAEGHGTPVFAESKTEESRADDSAVADLPKAVAEEFEIPPAESVTATAAAGDFWNDDDDDEGLFDHDDHANEEWDETIREADGEPASNPPQEHGEFTVPPSVDSGSNSFMAATLPPASDVSSSIRGSVHQEEVEFSSSEFASRSNFESPSADNARFEGAAQQQWEQESVAAAVVPPATSLHPTAVAAEQVQEQPSVTSVGGDDAEHDTSSSVTTGVSFSEEHSTRLEHHTHGVSFADEMQADNSTQEQASTAWHSEEQPIDTSTTDYDTTIDTATNYEDHGETSSEMETADYEHSTGFAKSSVSWESEAIREGGADNSHGEVESVEAPAATPGKTLDSDDHDDHDEYRGDSVSLFNGTGGSNGGQSLASFSEVSSRLPPYGYQSSFAGPGSEASSTEPGTRDMDGSSIRSYGVSSAGATFGGSERVSEGPFSDGTASETPSIVDSSNASTAFGTDFPSVSEGQFSAPGTTFGGSDNVSDQFSDGNASETTSVSESTTHTTTGFVSEYQPSTGHYVTETIAETSSLNPFPDDSMDERASRGLELHNVTTTTSVASLFGSTPDVPEYSQASLSFSHDQESSRAQYTSPPALPTESVQDQEDRSLVAETSKEVQTADALFGSSSEAPSPFSSFGGSGAAPSNSPPLVVEHELPTSDASDLFGSSAPGDTGIGFGSASAQSSGFGYDNTPYAQHVQQQQQQQSYEQHSYGQYGQEAPSNQPYGSNYDSYEYERAQYGQAERDPFQQQQAPSTPAQDMFGASSQHASAGDAASLFSSTSSASNVFETSSQQAGNSAAHEQPSYAATSNYFGSSQGSNSYDNGYYSGDQSREASFGSAPTASAESMFASGPAGNDPASAFGSSGQQSASQLFGSQDHSAAADSPFNSSGYNAPELTRHESASSVFSTHSAQSASFGQTQSGLTGAVGSTPSTPSASSAFSHDTPTNEPSSFGYTDRHAQSQLSDSHPPKHPQRGAHGGYETNEFFYATSRQAHHGFGHGSGDASSFYGSSQATEAQQFVAPNATPASADAFFGQSTSSTGASIGGTSAPSTPGAASTSSWFESSRSSATGPPELQRGSSNASSAHNDQQLGATADTQQWSSFAEVSAGSYESTTATEHATAAETAHHGHETAVFGHQGDQNEYAQSGLDATSVFTANTSDASTFQYGSSYDQFSHEQQAPTPDAFASPPVDAPTEYGSSPQPPQHDVVPSADDAYSDVKNSEPRQVVEATEPVTTEQQQKQEQQAPDIQTQDEGAVAASFDGFDSAPSSDFDQSGNGDFASTPFDQGNTSADFDASASPFDNAGEPPSLFSAPPPQEGGGLEGASQQNDFFASGPPADGASSFFSGNGYGSETYGQQVQQDQGYGIQPSAGAFGTNANQSGAFFGQQQQQQQQYQEQYVQPGQQQQYPQPDQQQQYEQAQQNQQSAYQQQYQQDQFEMQQQQQQSFVSAPQVASPQNQFQQTVVDGYGQDYSSVQAQQYQHPAPQLQQFPTTRPAGLNRGYPSPGFGATKASVASPVSSPAFSSLATATHSPAVKTSNKYKDPSRVAPSCLVAFGFGGNVVTMFPKRKLLLNIAGSSFRNSPRTAVPSQPEHAGHGELRKGPVGVYRMEQLHPKDEFMEQLEKFPGPLTESVGDDSVLQYLEERMTQLETNGGVASEDERLLFGVLRVLVKCNGKLSSSPSSTAAPGSPHSDPNSPEALLIELLRESDRRRQAVRPVTIPAPRPAQTGMHPDVMAKNAAHIRELLLVGDRMAAVEAAMSAHMWAEALLLAQSTTRDEYTRVVRLFLDAHFSSGDPSRALLLALADQQEKSVQEPQRLLQTRLHPSGDNTAPTSLILATWVRHAQMLIANANADTSAILTELGDRLWRETDAVAAAHGCYLLAGLGVEAPSAAAKMALLGADHRSPAQARFYVSASSVQRTEVYEWAQRRALGSSATILLPFQGYKLIHAMVLADHGKLETAFRYVSAMLSVIRGITATMKPGTSMYLEGMQNQLTVLDDRLRQHLGQDRVATVTAAVAASNSRGGAGGRQGKWGLGSMLRKMGNVVNSIVEGGDAPPTAAASSSAAQSAGGLFAGAAPGAIESPSAASAPAVPAFANNAPGSARGNGSASGSVHAPGSSRSIQDYASPAQQQLQQPPKSTSSSGPFSGRGGSDYTAPAPAPLQPPQQESVEQQQYDQQYQQPYDQQAYDHQQQYGQQAYDHQQQYDQQQYDQQQYQQQSDPQQQQQPYVQQQQEYDQQQFQSQSQPQQFDPQHVAPPPSGPYSNTGSVGSGPPSAHGHPLVQPSAAPQAPQTKFFGYNPAQQQPPRSNDSRASHGYGPGSNSGMSAPAMMAPMATPPLSSSSASSLSGGRFLKPQLDLSGDAGPRGAFPAQDKAPHAASTADAKELEAKATTKAAVLASSGPASDKGKASPKHQDLKKGGRSKTPPPSSSKSGSGWFSGLSSLASGFIASKMNPDAKVAKLGEQMEAYYDEEKKRWVFPGETEAEEPSVPSAPPMGPLPGSTPASMSGLGGGGPPMPSSGPQSAPGAMANAANDPLAALMAPPPMRAHATLMNKDPLAAMMAPPPARVPSMYGGGSQRGRGMGGPGSGRLSRPQFKVFKPVASSAPAPQGDSDAPPSE